MEFKIDIFQKFAVKKIFRVSNVTKLLSDSSTLI